MKVLRIPMVLLLLKYPHPITIKLYNFALESKAWFKEFCRNNYFTLLCYAFVGKPKAGHNKFFVCKNFSISEKRVTKSGKNWKRQQEKEIVEAVWAPEVVRRMTRCWIPCHFMRRHYLLKSL